MPTRAKSVKKMSERSTRTLIPPPGLRATIGRAMMTESV